MTTTLRPLLLITLVTVVPNEVLFACPVCFRIDDPPTASGVYAAVFVLLGVTTLVLAGFAAFLVRFVRRARRLEHANADLVS